MDHALAENDLKPRVARFLDVYNASLAAHRGVFPYRQIWDAAGMATLRLHLAMTIGNHSFSAVLRQGQLGFLPETCCGCEACFGEKRAWRVPMDMLEMVVNHPAMYIGQPALLDWDWLLVGAGEAGTAGGAGIVGQSRDRVDFNR